MMRHRVAICRAILILVSISSTFAQHADSSATTAGSPSKITNADVISLVAAGMSEEVVINAIRQSNPPEFDLSAAGLLSLKKAKVPDAVILAMQNMPGSVGTKDATTTAPPKQESTPSEHVGMYSRIERRGDKPPFGDYINLEVDGTYWLSHPTSQSNDKGTYKIDGTVIVFTPSDTPSGHPAGKCLFLKPPGTIQLKDGKIVEPDGTEWASLAAILATTEALKQRMKQRSGAAAAPVCPGVEMMGLYKNEIFDRAMGGGIVEWLAKIRNNTSVTKLVVFGWIDSNGQQQRAQVQISGGGIASPRVDMTQAKYIAPVQNLRVLSCE